MKRRTFNQAALAGLVSGLSLPLGANNSPYQATTLERFRYSTAENEQTWLPFTIGLGQRGRILAKQFDQLIDRDRPALIYAASGMTTSPREEADHEVEALLNNVYSGVLMLALEESEAWPLALAWADLMSAQDVYLKVAILCVQNVDTALSHPLTQQLMSVLDTVILQQDYRGSSHNSGYQPALQSARLFLMEQGLICWDIADLRTVLSGHIAVTTSAQTMPSSLGGNPSQAMDACYADLQGRRITGAISHWSTSLEGLCIEDFSDIGNRRDALLADDCTVVLATSANLSLSETEPGILHTIWTLPTEA